MVLLAVPNRSATIEVAGLLKGRSLEKNAPVAFLTVTIGDTGWLLQTLAEGRDDGHYRGAILAAMGGGHVPERLVPAIAQIAQRIPVVMVSRAGSGALLLGTYGFGGAEIDLLGRGLISAGWLHPYKSAALLELLLRADLQVDAISAAFAGFN